MASPLNIDVLRGHRVESRHIVDAVIVDRDGSVVDSWGDPDRQVIPRSAAKPIQALPLITTGAAAAFELGDVEIALACASHNGEEAQVERVTAWLHRLELSATDLECGPHEPIYRPAAIELVASGQRAGPEHNNCSGKHSGFLTVCRHLGLPTADYIQPGHLVHRDHVTKALEETCDVDLSGQEPVIDGCGIPVWTMALHELARGWARLTEAGPGPKVLRAMMAQPYFVAGTDRSSTELMTDPLHPVAVKGGAEGVYCGAVIGEGLGIALKVRDGAGRAADVAIEHLLAGLGVVERTAHRLHNCAGTEVGVIRVGD